MILTKRLELIPITPEDTELIVKWRNTDYVVSQMFSSDRITIDKHMEWFEKYKASDTRKEFIIRIREGTNKIGTIGLSNIDLTNRKAEYGILVGEVAFEGKGYAREASEAILKYAFINLKLNKVYLKVFADNNRALALYRSLNFFEEGYLKEDILKETVFRDVIFMSILFKDWKKIYENSCI